MRSHQTKNLCKGNNRQSKKATYKIENFGSYISVKGLISKISKELRQLNSKKKKKISIGKDVEKRELWCTGGGKINQYSHYGKQHESFLKKI